MPRTSVVLPEPFGPDQGNHLAAAHPEVDLVDGRAVAVADAHRAQLDDRFGVAGPGLSGSARQGSATRLTGA